MTQTISNLVDIGNTTLQGYLDPEKMIIAMYVINSRPTIYHHFDSLFMNQDRRWEGRLLEECVFNKMFKKKLPDLSKLDPVNQHNLKVQTDIVCKYLKDNCPEGGHVKYQYEISSPTCTKIRPGKIDYLLPEQIIEMKCSYSSNNYLMASFYEDWGQLLLYWLIGMESEPERFSKIKKLVWLNPRLNMYHEWAIENVMEQDIDRIKREILGIK